MCLFKEKTMDDDELNVIPVFGIIRKKLNKNK